MGVCARNQGGEWHGRTGVCTVGGQTSHGEAKEQHRRSQDAGCRERGREPREGGGSGVQALKSWAGWAGVEEASALLDWGDFAGFEVQSSPEIKCRRVSDYVDRLVENAVGEKACGPAARVRGCISGQSSLGTMHTHERTRLAVLRMGAVSTACVIVRDRWQAQSRACQRRRGELQTGKRYTILPLRIRDTRSDIVGSPGLVPPPARSACPVLGHYSIQTLGIQLAKFILHQRALQRDPSLRNCETRSDRQLLRQRPVHVRLHQSPASSSQCPRCPSASRRMH